MTPTILIGVSRCKQFGFESSCECLTNYLCAMFAEKRYDINGAERVDVVSHADVSGAWISCSCRVVHARLCCVYCRWSHWPRNLFICLLICWNMNVMKIWTCNIASNWQTVVLWNLRVIETGVHNPGIYVGTPYLSSWHHVSCDDCLEWRVSWGRLSELLSATLNYVHSLSVVYSRHVSQFYAAVFLNTRTIMRRNMRN